MQVEEQTTPQEPTTPSAEEPSQEPAKDATHADLLEEAKKAFEATPADGDQPATETPAAEEEPNWKRLIAAREKAQAERAAAQDYATEAKKRAEEEAKAIVEAAKKQAADEIAQERQRWKDRFQLDPEGALAELGSGEEVGRHIIDLNTPQGKALAQIKKDLQEARKAGGEVKDVRKEFEDFKKQVEADKNRSAYETAKQEFFSVHATKEAAPYLNARYNAEEIESRANKVAKDWTEAGIQFALSDIAQYLEHEAKEKLASLGAPAGQQVRPATSGKIAPQVSANGSRTITAAAGSERRASPKAFHEMTPEEQKADLIEEARKAWKAAGGR